MVDASAMRYVTNGNIYAPVMMMAEKAADLILGNTPLAPEPVDFYRHVARSTSSLRHAERGRSDNFSGWAQPSQAATTSGLASTHFLAAASAVMPSLSIVAGDLVLLLGGQLELRQEVERRLVLGLEPGVGRLVQLVDRVVAGVPAVGGRGRCQAGVGDVGQLRPR